jgi:hypothetical protein
MSNVVDMHQEIPGCVYFILNRHQNGYSEVGVTAEGELFIRFTNVGKVMAHVPLGKANTDAIATLKLNLDRICDFFLNQKQ